MWYFYIVSDLLDNENSHLDNTTRDLPINASLGIPSLESMCFIAGRGQGKQQTIPLPVGDVEVFMPTRPGLRRFGFEVQYVWSKTTNTRDWCRIRRTGRITELDLDCGVEASAGENFQLWQP
ncbi:hypothetical protein TWF132_001107 [Orbilia oligospora]|nr:hypothetical protein TWF132_001107 [Orbilia oligospora]